MDFLTKWQFKQTLSEEEAILVLKELYNGANKQFIFNSISKINNLLYSLYEKFPENTQSELFLRFSENETDSPFVSTCVFENLKPQHTIPTEDFVIYVY
jgi:hypothetical protein